MKLICVTSNLPKEYKLPGIKDYDHTFYKSQYLLTRKLSCLFHSSNGEFSKTYILHYLQPQKNTLKESTEYKVEMS